MSSIKPNPIQGCFICAKCEGIQIVKFVDGKYSLPSKCRTEKCTSSMHIFDRLSPDTITVDWQKVKLQEIINDDRNDSGRIPRSVEVELTNHLVDSCVPGDVVQVAGIVKVMTTDEGKGKTNNMFIPYIDANSVTLWYFLSF